jgi:hypothetical protein
LCLIFVVNLGIDVYTMLLLHILHTYIYEYETRALFKLFFY